MLARFLQSRWWHLFAAFYMASIIFYIIFFALTQHILMIGFLISNVFMLGIEMWIFFKEKNK